MKRNALKSNAAVNNTSTASGDDHVEGDAQAGYDPNTAERAFTELKKEREALTEDALSTPNLDVVYTVGAVLRLCEEWTSPSMRARFAALPRAEFDITRLDRLDAAAWAVWYARMMYLTASASATTALVPAELSDAASALRSRMIDAVEYHIDNVDGVAAELGSIREGSGFLDLAMDLSRLAQLYQKHQGDLPAKGDRKYRPEDVAAASRMSADILKHLNANDDPQARWSKELTRAWTLLTTWYGDVRETAVWLDRSRDGATRYPKLNALRKVQSRKSAEATPAEPTPVTPTPVEPSDPTPKPG